MPETPVSGLHGETVSAKEQKLAALLPLTACVKLTIL